MSVRFMSKYSQEKWFIDNSLYLSGRLSFIQERLINTFRYVEPNELNIDTFSYEYSSILRDLGSAFISTMHSFVKNASGKERTDITDYINILVSEIPDISRISIGFRPHFPLSTVMPFFHLTTDGSRSKWWDAYNAVKHSEYDNFKDGNLGNCINALAALKLIASISKGGGSDELWANVGVTYPESDPSFSNRPFKKFE